MLAAAARGDGKRARAAGGGSERLCRPAQLEHELAPRVAAEEAVAQ